MTTTTKKFYSTDKFGTAWWGKVEDMREDYQYEDVKYFDSEDEAIGDVKKREEIFSIFKE